MATRFSTFRLAELAARARLGDGRALARLLGESEPLIGIIAHSGRYWLPCGEVEDLKQEGRLAVVRAALSYNCQRGPWTQHVKKAIHWAMAEAVRNQLRPSARVLTAAGNIDDLDWDDPALDAGGDPADGVSRAEAYRWLRALLMEALTPRQISVLEGNAPEVTGNSRSCVLYKARRKAMALLQEEGAAAA